MSLSSVLGSALSGLTASQAGLKGIADNIANADTPGYARVTVQTEAAVAGGSIFGVRALEAIRIADRYLEKADAAARGDAGRAEILSDWLNRAVGLFGSPGVEGGFETALSSIQSSAIALSGAYLSTQGKDEFVGALTESINVVSRIATDITVMRSQVDDEIGRLIPQINSLLVKVNSLNEDLVTQQALGRSVSGLADQRTAAINELGGLIGIVTREEPSGRIVIETKGGQVLVDKRVRQLEPGPERFGNSASEYTDLSIVLMDGNGLPTTIREALDPVGAGGKIAGLLQLRDVELPLIADSVGLVIEGIMASVNNAAAEATRAPAPNTLTGQQTGLLGQDGLNFSGTTTVGLLNSNGELLARADVDGANVSSIDDFVSQIQAQLGGQATVSFTNGVLNIQTSNPASGIAITGGKIADGRSVASVFGINAIINTTDRFGAALPITADMAHGASAGETLAISLRDASGRPRADFIFEPAALGDTFGDILAHLNSGEMAPYGTFEFAETGALKFTPFQEGLSYSIDLIADSTFRGGTGETLSSLMRVGNGRHGSILSTAQVLENVRMDPSLLPISKFDSSKAIGETAIARSDTTGGDLYAEMLTKPLAGAQFYGFEVDRLGARMLSLTSGTAREASSQAQWLSSRSADFTARRENYSSVNVDEEMAQMIILQNSYTASTRVVSAAREMLDDLIQMVG